MKEFVIEFEIKSPFQERYKLSGKADKSGNGPILLDPNKCFEIRRGILLKLSNYTRHYIMITHGDEIKEAIKCAAES